ESGDQHGNEEANTQSALPSLGATAEPPRDCEKAAPAPRPLPRRRRRRSLTSTEIPPSASVPLNPHRDSSKRQSKGGLFAVSALVATLMQVCCGAVSRDALP